MATTRPTRVASTIPFIGRRAGFTLIELMVVSVIISILASLSLAGMAGARQRAKIEKTKSTIRKIDSVIRPMYDSYRNRRANVATSTSRGSVAQNLLYAKRDLMLREMPDTPEDVTVVTGSNSFSSMPGYIAYRSGKTSTNGSAECLYMIVARSGFDPDALESFRSDEIADGDSDGAPEFIDGWGNPIIFLRWAPGWLATQTPPLPQKVASLQVPDAVNSHDPLDPFRVDSSAYELVPLITSGGPDGLTGLTVVSNGWIAYRPLSTLIVSASGTPSRLIGGADSSTPPACLDNITNHDLLKK